MDNLGSRETLKLLKISDDSNKNNSDLDLPEITNQRKRKVRRKHRPRLISSSSSNSNLNHSSDFHGTKISSAQRKQCSNVLVLWFTFIVICWLVTLSYMIAVIHSENLRLQVQIKKLEGSTQSLPDILQNWHETSKYLQDNQTQINSKVLEYHKEIQNLTQKLDQLSLDSSKTSFTKEEFANLGAKVKSVFDDVEQLKTRISEFATNQNKFTNDLKTLTDNVNSSLTKITNSSGNTYNVEVLNTLEAKMLLNYQNLNETVQSFIKTSDQKIKDVSEMFKNNSGSLEKLMDKSESINSHVESMEKDWPSILHSTSSYNATFNALRDNIEELRNTTRFMDASISELRLQISKVNEKKEEVKKEEVKVRNDELSFLDEQPKIKVPATVTSTNTTTALPATTKTDGSDSVKQGM